MKLETATFDSVSVVRCEGTLDTNTSGAAHDYLNKLLDQGASKVVVNFENVDFVSSAGLRILLATAKRLTGSGGDLRICGLNEAVNEVFEISGFSTILDVFSSQEEALQGF